MPKKIILLTGSTGYIGAHTWCSLLTAGYDVIGLDNLCNSSSKVLNRIAKIIQRKINFVEGDVRDASLLEFVFLKYNISAVINFAALKAAGESVKNLLAYYDTNLNGLLALSKAMASHGVKKFVFSSSATVYGDPHAIPIKESFPVISY